MVECARCGYRNPDGVEFCGNPTGCRAYLGFDGKKVATLPGGIALAISSTRLTVNPGKETTAEIRIQNKSEVVDGYVFSAVPDWVIVEPQTVSLFPGKDQSVSLRFRPPRASTTPAGQVPFTVTATSKSSPSVMAEQAGIVEVGTFGDLAVQLTPQTSHATPIGSHRLGVQNRGNTPIQVALEATDPEEALSFDIDRPILRIDPGGTEFAQLQVRVKNAAANGSSKQYPFHLEVRPDATTIPPTRVDGYTLVGPAARRLRVPWLVLGAIAIVLMVAAFMLPRLAFGAGRAPAPAAAMGRVPDTTNLIEADAARLLVAAGFTTDHAAEPSDTATAGRVIRTDPAANSSAPKKAVITIVVSSGKASTPAPQVAIRITDITLLNSEHDIGDVYLALYMQVRLPDGSLTQPPFVWNRSGAALGEGTDYRVELPLGNYPAGSTLVIHGYTDSNDGNRTPSAAHHENDQGAINYGPLTDPARQNTHVESSRNDQQHPGFRVTIFVTPLT